MLKKRAYLWNRQVSEGGRGLGLADGVLLVLQEAEHVVDDGRIVDRLVSMLKTFYLSLTFRAQCCNTFYGRNLCSYAVFDPFKPLQPSLMLVSKTRSLSYSGTSER